MGGKSSKPSGSNNNNAIKGLTKEQLEEQRIRGEKRKKAVDELIETENTYVTRLDLCIKHFADPSKNNLKLLTPQQHAQLFKDLGVIHGLNNTFLNDLKQCSLNWDNNKSMIGDQFIKFTPYFKMYQNYMNNYEKSMELLPKLLEKPAFLEFCNEARKSCGNAELQSLLILPIQRMPRYSLTLKEIIKNTEPTHPDMRDLKRGLECVEETTQLLNEGMKEFESRRVVRSIEKRFGNAVSFVIPSRKFMHEGTLTKVHRTGKDREYIFILFNDLLVYATGFQENKDKTEKLKLHAQLPIDRAFWTKDMRHNDKYSDRAFEIHSSVKSFIVVANEYNIKKKWLTLISKAMKEQVNQPGKTQERELAAPLMVPDDFSDICQIKDCAVKFTFINRRHHCRYCGKLMCGKCGKYKLAHKMYKNKIVKPVCVKCYELWNDINPAPKNGTVMNDSDDSGEEESKEESKGHKKKPSFLKKRSTSRSKDAFLEKSSSTNSIDGDNKPKHVKQRSSLFGMKRSSKKNVDTQELKEEEQKDEK